ncbi:MAG: hypothetical protein IT289_01540 [Oligoflexia bacterium]|nr:hypothetical protein [Oligoflexia bacterium]
MVYLSKSQMAEVEYLFNQSAQGIHVLFDNAMIRKVLSRPTEEIDFFTFENVNKVQKVLSDFIAKESLAAKKAFLESLDQDTHELLLRTYFNIVENSIYEQGALKH